MKTSNWILALFFASFMIVSTIAFTVANYYSDNKYDKANLRTEEMPLESFSVIVVQGRGRLNFAQEEVSKIQFSSYEEAGDWMPEISVRNDTCFVDQIKDKEYWKTLSIQTGNLKSVILKDETNFHLDKFDGDSLHVESHGGRFHYTPQYPNRKLLQIAGTDGAYFHLTSVYHVQIRLDKSDAYLNGQTDILEGDVGKDSHIIIDKSPQQILINKTENGSVTMHR